MKRYSTISANRVWSRTTGAARAVRLDTSVANGSGGVGEGGGGALTSTAGMGHAPPHIKVAYGHTPTPINGKCEQPLNHR